MAGSVPTVRENNLLDKMLALAHNENRNMFPNSLACSFYHFHDPRSLLFTTTFSLLFTTAFHLLFRAAFSLSMAGVHFSAVNSATFQAYVCTW